MNTQTHSKDSSEKNDLPSPEEMQSLNNFQTHESILHGLRKNYENLPFAEIIDGFLASMACLPTEISASVYLPIAFKCCLNLEDLDDFESFIESLKDKDQTSNNADYLKYQKRLKKLYSKNIPSELFFPFDTIELQTSFVDICNQRFAEVKKLIVLDGLHFSPHLIDFYAVWKAVSSDPKSAGSKMKPEEFFAAFSTGQSWAMGFVLGIFSFPEYWNALDIRDEIPDEEITEAQFEIKRVFWHIADLATPNFNIFSLFINNTKEDALNIYNESSVLSVKRALYSVYFLYFIHQIYDYKSLPETIKDSSFKWDSKLNHFLELIKEIDEKMDEATDEEID